MPCGVTRVLSVTEYAKCDTRMAGDPERVRGRKYHLPLPNTLLEVDPKETRSKRETGVYAS